MATVYKAGGRQYDAADATVTIFGYEEKEVKEFDYNYDRKHNRNKVLKGDGSWSMGGIEDPKASLTLYMTAVQKIRKIAKQNGTSDLTLLKPFPVVFTYVNDELEEVTDRITMKFMNDGKNVTGEGGLATKYDMFVTKIELDI